MSDILWVLGAGDNEMTAIEEILVRHKQNFVRANVAGQRVWADNAYRADRPEHEGDVVTVECGWYGDGDDERIIARCDHHRPGDGGFGWPPSLYWEASSIGQVVYHLASKAEIDVSVTEDMRMVAAGDHCPGAAYAGECPDIHVGKFKKFRIDQKVDYLMGQDASWLAKRAKDVLDEIEYPHRERLVEELLAMSYGVRREVLRDAVNRALSKTRLKVIQSPPMPGFGGSVADCRELGETYGLPDALCELGLAAVYMLPPLPGRDTKKVGIIGAGLGSVPGTCPVKHFMETWGPEQGLHDIYGDPARGYAGGYMK